MSQCVLTSLQHLSKIGLSYAPWFSLSSPYEHAKTVPSKSGMPSKKSGTKEARQSSRETEEYVLARRHLMFTAFPFPTRLKNSFIVRQPACTVWRDYKSHMNRAQISLTCGSTKVVSDNISGLTTTIMGCGHGKSCHGCLRSLLQDLRRTPIRLLQVISSFNHDTYTQTTQRSPQEEE